MKTYCPPLERNILTPLKLFFQEQKMTPSFQHFDLWLPERMKRIEAQLKNLGRPHPDLIIGALSGYNHLSLKDRLWALLHDSYGRPQAERLMPPTYLLNDKEQMNLFNRRFETDATYILKKNIQRKEGIRFESHYPQILAAKEDGFVLVQDFLRNTFMVHDHRMVLRLYLLVTSQNGAIDSYLHQDGKCLYAAHPHGQSDEDESQVTSSSLSPSIYRSHPHNTDELARYIKNQSLSWESIWKKITFSLQRVIQAATPHLGKLPEIQSNRCFELFGVDVLLQQEGQELHPLIIEMNMGPDMEPKFEWDLDLKHRIYQDLFQVIRAGRRQGGFEAI